jgi:hypothetical protein
LAALIGGAIAIVASLATTLVTKVLDVRQERAIIRSVVLGELAALYAATQHYRDGLIAHAQLEATKPLLSSLATSLGNLPPNQAKAHRLAITLFTQLRLANSTNSRIASWLRATRPPHSSSDGADRSAQNAVR